VPGQLYPNVIEYAPDETVATAVRDALPRSHGQILCFLPGVPEIERAQRDLAATGVMENTEVIQLHGSIDGETQDQVLRATSARRVILATNIAETSLTVPGVATVVDTGFHKVARYDGARGVDTLTLERVSQDSADQRAGRAARTGPGLVRRLWDSRQRLQPHREADISRLDLAGPILYLIAWGEHPERFEWFEAPPADRIETALRLLTRLGAINHHHHVTPLGREMLRIPTHPRLARILIDGRGAPEVVNACAKLSGDMAFAVQLQRVVGQVLDRPPSRHISDSQLRHALFTGYGDRLGRRRRDDRNRVLLATGHGAVISRECDEFDDEFLVALEVVSSGRPGVSEARIRSASPVDTDWIVPTSSAVEHQLDTATGRVRAAEVRRYDALVLSEHPVSPDPIVAASLLAEAWLARGPEQRSTRLTRRARFAGHNLDVAALVRDAAFGVMEFDEIDIAQRLPYDLLKRINADAPESLSLPSGRSARLEYEADGSVSAAVKLQELFGLADSPRLGPQKVPVTFHLLAPNGRSVQTTRDLRSFWERTYPEVRKELRGRYPKHPWPEDPWSAVPTHRTTRTIKHFK
jgi:ATP-dependent helicase HrpB